MLSKSVAYSRSGSWDAHIQMRRTQEALCDFMQYNRLLMQELMDPAAVARLDFYNVNATAKNRQALANLADTLTDPADIARVTEALERFDEFAKSTVVGDLQHAADLDALPRTQWPFEVNKQNLLADLNSEKATLQNSVDAIQDPAQRAQRAAEIDSEVIAYNRAIKEMEAGNNPMYRLDAEVRMAEYRVEQKQNSLRLLLNQKARARDLAAEQNRLAGLQRARDRVRTMINRNALESADDILRRYQNLYGGSLTGTPGSPNSMTLAGFEPFPRHLIDGPVSRPMTASIDAFRIVQQSGEKLVDSEIASSIMRFKHQTDADLFGGNHGAYSILASAEDELRQIAVNFQPMLESGLSPESYARVDFNDFSSVRQALQILANGSQADEALVARQTLAHFDRRIRDTIEAAMDSADTARGSVGSWRMNDRQLLVQALNTEAQQSEIVADRTILRDNWDDADEMDLPDVRRHVAARYRSLALAVQSGADPVQVLDDQIKQLTEQMNAEGLKFYERMLLQRQHTMLERIRVNVIDIVGDLVPPSPLARLDQRPPPPAYAKTDPWADLWRPVQTTAEGDEFHAAVAPSVRFVDGEGAAAAAGDLSRASDLTNPNGVLPPYSPGISGLPDDAPPMYTRTPARNEASEMLSTPNIGQFTSEPSYWNSHSWPSRVAGQPRQNLLLDVVDTGGSVWAWPPPQLALPNGIDGTELATTLRTAESALVNPNNLPSTYTTRGGVALITPGQEALAARTAMFRLAIQRIDDGMDPIVAIDDYIAFAKANGASTVEVQAYQDIHRGVTEAMTELQLRSTTRSTGMETVSNGRRTTTSTNGAPPPSIGNNRVVDVRDPVDVDFVPPPPPPPPASTSSPTAAVDAIDQYGRVVGDAASGSSPPSGTSQLDETRRLEELEAAEELEEAERLRELGWRHHWELRNERHTYRSAARRRRFKGIFRWRWRSPSSLSRSYTRNIPSLDDAVNADVTLRIDAVEPPAPASSGSAPSVTATVQNDELRHVLEAQDVSPYASYGTRQGDASISVLEPAPPPLPPRPGQAAGDGFRPLPPLPDATDPAYETAGSHSEWLSKMSLFAPENPNHKTIAEPRHVRKQVLRAADAATVTEDGVLVFRMDQIDLDAIHEGRRDLRVLGANGQELPLSKFRLELERPDYMMSDHDRWVATLVDIADKHEDTIPSQGRLNREFLMEMHHGDKWMDFPMPLPFEVSPMRVDFSPVEISVNTNTGVASFVPTPMRI